MNLGRVKNALQVISAGYAVWAGQLLFRSSEDNREGYELYRRLFTTNLKTGMEVLEVGYDDGENNEFYPSGVSLTGLDPKFSDKSKRENSFAKLSEKLAKNGSRLKTLTNGACEALPFPSGSFDAVVSTKVLCTVVDPAKSIEEISRVLKPGGVYICVEHILADDDGVDIGTTPSLHSDRKATPAVRKDVILSTQQKMFNPLQVKLADGCHLNRRTDLLLKYSVGNGKPFKELLQLKYADFGSQWPISRQIFVALKK
jgi:SAM-dependent methyltransferase